jgi:hypothetical protein
MLLTLTDWTLIAQTKNAPRHEWKTVTYRDKNIINQPGLSQANSGDEWWFAHQNLYENGVHVGYVAVGYLADLIKSSDPNSEANARMVFNEGTGSPFNPYGTSGSLFYSDAPPDGLKAGCSEFYDNMNVTASTVTPNPIEAAEDRTLFRGIVARLDLKGKMIWCRLANIHGDGLENLRIFNGHIYVIGHHQGVKSMFTSAAATRTFIPYNRETTAPANYFSTTTYTDITTLGTHMYVAKFNFDGSRIWEGLYGNASFAFSPSIAAFTYSEGWDLEVNSGDSLIYAVGRAGQGTNPMTHQIFVAKIDPANGNLVSKNVLPMMTMLNSNGNAAYFCRPQSICQINANGTAMAIGGKAIFSGTNQIDPQRGIVYSITQNLTLNNAPGNWTSGSQPGVFMLPPSTLTTIQGNRSSNIWNVKFHPQLNEVLVAAMHDCEHCGDIGNNYGYGKIYRLAAQTGTLSSQGTNPSQMGEVNAFDLRVGVTPTSDGGFAAVSSRKTSGSISIPSATTAPSAFGQFSVCSTIVHMDTVYGGSSKAGPNIFGHWDTDPLICKFDANGDLEWEWSEDYVPNRARALPPGDFRRGECMYQITEAADRGLVISGNCSFNHDDFYMVKLYPDCQPNTAYTYTGSGAQNTVVWSGTNWQLNSSNPIRINGNLIVGSGQKLELMSGLRMEFADELITGKPSGIEVRPGGQLVLHSGVEVTSISPSVCPAAMWKGIDLVGQSTANQGSSNNYTNITTQGFLVINSATISNARGAVTTGTHYANGGFNWGTTGGVIKAENAYFINNLRDLQYLTYANPANPNLNKAIFDRCHFLTTAKLNSGDPPLPHITLCDVRVMYFNGCEFAYTAGNAYKPMERGIGIFSYNSSFTIKDYCPTAACSSFTQSTFTNLPYGIAAVNSIPLRVANIDHAKFTSAYYYSSTPIEPTQLTLSNCNYANVTRCDFKLNDIADRGIYINDSKYYTISHNTFSASVNGYGYGLTATQSKGGQHKIFKNDFHKLWWGLISNYENSGNLTNVGDPDDGLKMNCNRFFDNGGMDVFMYGSNQAGFKSAVARNQGIMTSDQNPTKLVRNWYTAPCGNNNQWNIEQGSSTVNIGHAAHSDIECRPLNSSSCGDALLSIPASSVGYNYITHCADIAGAPSCPCTGCCKYGDISVWYSAAGADLTNTQSEYDDKIDGGNTASLLNELEDGNLTSSQIASIVYAAHPYLSDEVLISAFSHANIGAPEIIEIHNRNRPVTQTVWNTLLDLGLSTQTMDTLQAHQALQPLSSRRMLEDRLSRAKSELAYFHGQKVGYFLTDTLATAADSVFSLLGNNEVYIANRALQRLQAYANYGHYNRAFSYADSLSNIGTYADIMLLELALLKLDTMAGKARNLPDFAQIRTTLESFAADTARLGCWQARAVLYEVFGAPMDLMFPPAPPSERKRFPSKENPQTISEPEEVNDDEPLSGFHIFPNPANNEISFEFESRVASEATIFVRDVLSRECIRLQIRAGQKLTTGITMFKEGIYFVTLIDREGHTRNSKLVISR